ncbi:hypothetical protein AB0C76_31775 [Kitasatospora sp. NPDC048722]|uniref:hypothetical protein n=1 Tax=Kitasatospora sp. NPDC048722 TaxID=3155639 RepID=UPI003405EE4B
MCARITRPTDNTASHALRTTGTIATVPADIRTGSPGRRNATAPVTPGDSYTLTLADQGDGAAGDPVYTSFDDVTVS